MLLDILTSDTVLFVSVMIIAFIGIIHFIIEDLKEPPV